MLPRTKPKLSRITFTIGTRQLVVHDALEMMWCLAASYLSWFTPITRVMSSPVAGAEITTLRAPPSMCLCASAALVNRPVDSRTMSTPRAFHGSLAGSFSASTFTVWPSTVIASALAVTVPS